jgi:hypothetical protein
MLLEKIPPFVKLVGWKYSFSGTSPHPHMSSRQKKWRGHRNQQKQSTNRAIGKQQLGFGVMPTKIVLLEIVEGPVLYTIISIHQQTSVPPPNSLTSFYLLKYLQAFFFAVSRIPFPDTPWNTRIFWASCSQDSNCCFPVKLTSRKYHGSREKEHSGDVGWVKPGKWGCICLDLKKWPMTVVTTSKVQMYTNVHGYFVRA